MIGMGAEKELQEVIREERRRGKRPVDESLRKEKQSLVRELLAGDDEAIFSESICALGLQEGSEAWKEAVSAWRAAKREHAQGRPGRP